jgi:PHD/YefM family antitoxin component YafN of YafNO toxin-antitoxin module
MVSFVDIRRSGFKAIKEEIEKDKKAIITYKGRAKFVILPIEEYNNLELDAIYTRVMNDYKRGKYKILSSDNDIDKHIENL